jgi:hypothetical protein
MVRRNRSGSRWFVVTFSPPLLRTIILAQKAFRYSSSDQPTLPSAYFTLHHHAPLVRIGPATWVIVPFTPLTSVLTSVEVVVGRDQTWVEPTVDTASLGVNLELGKAESVDAFQVPAVS